MSDNILGSGVGVNHTHQTRFPGTGRFNLQRKSGHPARQSLHGQRPMTGCNYQGNFTASHRTKAQQRHCIRWLALAAQR
eukprot:3641901-Alexandrium_andersonii.AAC.1